MVDFFKVEPFDGDIVKWCEKNIDFSEDVSCASDRFSLKGREYQREPLEAIRAVEWQA